MKADPANTAQSPFGYVLRNPTTGTLHKGHYVYSSLSDAEYWRDHHSGRTGKALEVLALFDRPAQA